MPTVRTSAPKPRAKRTQRDDPDAATSPANDRTVAEEATDLGHPIFGFAPVVTVSIEQIRYHGKKVIPSDRGRFRPEEIFDVSSIREKAGCGRMRVKGLGANNRACFLPVDIDVPDENGALDLVAEMPEEYTAAVAAVSSAAAAGAPTASGAPTANAANAAIDSRWETLLREMMRDTRERSREDMNSFTALVTTILSSRGENDGGAGKFWEAELRLCRAELAELRTKYDRLQRENLSLKTSQGDDGFLKEVVRVGAQRFGFMPGAEAGAPRAAPAGDGPAQVGLPTAAQFREYVKGGGAVDRATLERMVAMRAAGALDDDLWAIGKLLADQIGIPTGAP